MTHPSVQYERLNNIRGRGLTGSTRFVDMAMTPFSTFENFYRMECPMLIHFYKRFQINYKLPGPIVGLFKFW